MPERSSARELGALIWMEAKVEPNAAMEVEAGLPLDAPPSPPPSRPSLPSPPPSPPQDEQLEGTAVNEEEGAAPTWDDPAGVTAVAAPSNEVGQEDEEDAK